MAKQSCLKSLPTGEPRLKFTPHSDKQSDLIHSNEPLTIAGTGTQWGKSTAAALWFLRQIHHFTAPDTNFLLMAPTYKIMNQSMLPYFKRATEGLGTFVKAEAEFQLLDGRICYFRTAKDPDSIVGIPNVKAYWLDEAGKVSLYFHENIRARAAAKGARGLYTTSPYSRNWIYKDFVRPSERGQQHLLEDVKLIRASSWDNPYHRLHDRDERRKERGKMDERRFEQLFGGEWGKQIGLVYDCFDDVENTCAPFRLPNGTKFYGGIDWGHTEPFVIKVRAITPDGMHYSVSEFYKSGMTVPDQMAIAKAKMQTFGIRQFYCGADRPENILLFNQNGIPAVGVPERDIQVGTDLHYELIKTRKYKIMEGTSPYTVDEYETYHYPEPQELEDDDDAEDENPVGQNDHCCQAERYITLRTYRSHLRRAPHVPEHSSVASSNETQEQRLKRLLKPSHKRNE